MEVALAVATVAGQEAASARTPAYGPIEPLSSEMPPDALVAMERRYAQQGRAAMVRVVYGARMIASGNAVRVDGTARASRYLIGFWAIIEAQEVAVRHRDDAAYYAARRIEDEIRPQMPGMLLDSINVHHARRTRAFANTRGTERRERAAEKNRTAFEELRASLRSQFPEVRYRLNALIAHWQQP